MIITFGAAIPSGLFMPTLLTGSSLGGWAGIMIQTHYLPGIVPAQMALLGATAMLAGIQRSTVSLCVIMMEATGQVKVSRSSEYLKFVSQFDFNTPDVVLTLLV